MTCAAGRLIRVLALIAIVLPFEGAWAHRINMFAAAIRHRSSAR